MSLHHHFHRLGILLILLASLISHSAIALSLGEIKVRSYFAEPFLGEISLPAYTIDEMDGIEIGVASAKQHMAMGYELSKLSRNLRFTVKENNNGDLYIEVRSKSAIKDLSISFLLEVTTVSGRIIKGYDILLSPKPLPRNRQSFAAQTEPKPLSVSANAIKQGATTDPKITTANKTSKVRKLEGGGFEYRGVNAGESLSRIAQRIRPKKSMHMYQVMIALYNENPDSFLDGNINHLKAGSNLQLRNIDAITAISKTQAFELIQQYANNPNHHSTPKRTIADNAENTDKITADSAKEKHKLPVVNDEIPLMADVLSRSQPDALAAIKAQLKNANKQINELGIKNKALLERIAELEQQINETSKVLFSSDTSSPQLPAQSETNTLDGNGDTPVSPSVVDSNLKQVAANQPETSFLKENQTPISLTIVAILIVALIGIRKKRNPAIS